MAPDTSGVWIAWTKKSGFSRNRFFQTYVSTWSWPPDSPAKSYLKVFVFRTAVNLLWKDYACWVENSQKN
jgi:hypothetical protein